MFKINDIIDRAPSARDLWPTIIDTDTFSNIFPREEFEKGEVELRYTRAGTSLTRRTWGSLAQITCRHSDRLQASQRIIFLCFQKCRKSRTFKRRCASTECKVNVETVTCRAQNCATGHGQWV